jgi:hypothetical protein
MDVFPYRDVETTADDGDISRLFTRSLTRQRCFIWLAKERR